MPEHLISTSRRFLFLLPLIWFGGSVAAQSPRDLFRQDEVTRIEKILSADDMQGRQVYTPGIEKAAAFISQEFKSAGLKPLSGSQDYGQHFTMIDTRLTEVTVKLDCQSLDPERIFAFSAAPDLAVTQNSNYHKIFVKKGDDFGEVFYKYMDESQDFLILVDTSFSKRFMRYAHIHMPSFGESGNRIFILTSSSPAQFSIHIRQDTIKKSLTNLVGVLPGRSLKDEYVIFSAHYDHLGIGKPDAQGDSIYNGANDDASGTTAVISLAKYFSKLNSNQRTLIFAAFTAEEIGEFGSAYFSRQLNPERVMAMFNIEMIGTESKWGKNSAYITGYDKTDMGLILQKNLKNSRFKFYPDPYPDQLLFLRSDNATLAKLGVPAHTISTSKMDSEKFYHTREDEFGTLDMTNMTEIIKAIAISARSIIAGKDTPERVKR
ncbi:MAG: M28 family peptidase [Bacteroidota bacterium]|nr:M28 family peptidase [Bacteroidota bacterium]MDP4211563.1 M28 family peptidase [Bacteroidota bacterium]